MSVRPPRFAIRSRWRSRNARNWSVAWTRKSARSRAASAASSPSRSLRLVSIVASFVSRGSRQPWSVVVLVSRGTRRPWFWSVVVLEVGAHALAKKHRMVAIEQPLSCPVAQRPGRLIRLQPVEGRIIRELEEDDVVEVPAMGHVVPAEEPDSELRLVVAHLAGEQRAHEELEERISTTADGEIGREDGHGLAVSAVRGCFGLGRRLLSHAGLVAHVVAGRARLRMSALVPALVRGFVRGLVRALVLQLAHRPRRAGQGPA